MEKQRVQNRFASYEVHIGHLFTMSMLLSVLEIVLSIFRFKNFSPEWQTDKLTDGQNQLLNPFAHASAGNYAIVISVYTAAVSDGIFLTNLSACISELLITKTKKQTKKNT